MENTGTIQFKMHKDWISIMAIFLNYAAQSFHKTPLVPSSLKNKPVILYFLKKTSVVPKKVSPSEDKIGLMILILEEKRLSKDKIIIHGCQRVEIFNTMKIRAQKEFLEDKYMLEVERSLIISLILTLRILIWKKHLQCLHIADKSVKISISHFNFLKNKYLPDVIFIEFFNYINFI